MLPHAWPIQRLWNWDREGLQLHGAGATGTIGTTTATTAITIGRAGILTTFPGDVRVEGVTTLVGGETFEGLVTVTSAAGAGAAGALGPQEIVVQNTQAATAGATIRNPGYIDWQGRFWDGGASVSANFGRFGAVVDTQAAGVPSTYRLVWTNTAGTIQWSASGVGNTAQAGTGSFVAGAAIVSGTALTGTGAMGLASAGAGSVTLASAAGTLLTGTSAGAVTLDPATTLMLELTDNTAGALVAAEGARDYIRVGTLDAGATMAFGNATTNPTLQVLGSGQITLTGNVDALAGLDTTAVTTSAQAALSVGPFGAAAGNTGEVRFLELAAGGVNYVGFKAADALAGNVVWTLPSADAGAAGAALTSNAAGGLSWTAAAAALANERYVIIGPASGTLTDERVLTGTTNQIVLADGGAGGNITLSAPQNLHTAATPTFGAGTYTPGAAHVAFTVSPTWTAENFAHTALGVTATQDGANSNATGLVGLNVQMAKTGAGALAASVALEVLAPTVAGTLTSATGIHIANQGAAAGNAFGLDIDSQTAFAGGQYRAIRINGTGVLNALQLDTSAGGRRKYLYSSGLNTTNLTGDADTGGLQFTTGAVGGAMAIAAYGANSSLTVDANGTGAANFGTTATAHTTTLGSATSTAATTVQSGTGALNITALGNLALSATAGMLSVGIMDNQAVAWQVGEGARIYEAINTTDGSESMAFGNSTTNPTTTFNARSWMLTQNAQAAPAGIVAWTVTPGAHTALATAGSFTGSLLTAAATWTLADAATVTDGQSVRFNAPTFAGLVGGGTETVTNPATLYIPAAPVNGGNITFTNPAAALRLGGALRMEARVLGNQGSDVASANDLTLGTDGNCFEITGATQINAITVADWQNGSIVVLIFASTPTVKHNTAGGAGTEELLLANGADFAATAGDTLTLVLSEQGGARAWRELARTAIA